MGIAREAKGAPKHESSRPRWAEAARSVAGEQWFKSRTSLARDTAEEAAQEHWPRELRRRLKHEFQVQQRRAKCVAHCNNGPFTQLPQGTARERLEHISSNGLYEATRTPPMSALKGRSRHSLDLNQGRTFVTEIHRS